MLRTHTLLGDELGDELGDDEPLPEERTIPGTVDPAAVVAAEEKARRQRIMVVGGVTLLGVVVVGTLALVGLTSEKRSRVDRHPLREGQVRCLSHVKYSVGYQGRLKRVGTC